MFEWVMSRYVALADHKIFEAVISSIGLAFSLQLTKRSVSHPSTDVQQERP